MGAHTQEVVVAELVRRMLCGEPLLPLPQASQDLALLAYMLQKREAAITQLRARCEKEVERGQAVAPHLRTALYVDEILPILDSVQG